MSGKAAYDKPLRVTAIEEEIVFLGEGPISFSMTAAAARATLQSLTSTLEALQAEPTREANVVLVVDDDLLIRAIAVTVLEDAGYSVLVAESAAGALLILEAASGVRLLLTDVQMPGEIDGLELAHLVHDRWPAIRLLVASGRPIRAPASLPDGGRFLQKPYLAANVLRHVDELIADEAA